MSRLNLLWPRKFNNDADYSHFLLQQQAFALTPVIVVKSRKFAALFTLGSLCSLGR